MNEGPYPRDQPGNDGDQPMTIRHHRRPAVAGTVLTLAIIGHAVSANEMEWSPGPASWKGDLTPIAAADWSYDRAEHLLGRAGFGGTPEKSRSWQT